MQRLVLIVFFVLTIWPLEACAPKPTPTPNFHTQPQPTPSAVSPSPSKAEIASPAWAVQLSGAINSTPIISGDLVIVATADGVVHAVQAGTGESVWMFSPKTRVWDASVNADETRVCAGMEGGQIICLDALTGQTLWIFDAGQEVQSRVALTPDRVYAPTTQAGTGLETNFNESASLIALDAATGEFVWEAVTENYILRRPVIAGEIILTGGAFQVEGQAAGTIETRIYALNTEDGSVRWKYESNDGLVRWVDVSGETVVFSAASETVNALGLADGKLLWQFGPGYWMQFPAMQNGNIFFGSGDELFQAVNASNGQVVWQHEINMSSLNQIGRPLIQENRIWFNSVTGEVYALDAATGGQVKYLSTGRTSRVGGVLYQNLYIMGDPDGNLSAYEIE
ncbi:MAG: PQQ-binding-like beta-propeller repeat protein [Chloroflexi bacterium]|nr:PQQ-binding-like beta-propeller repeat protein [Chloroflexota bacterium]